MRCGRWAGRLRRAARSRTRGGQRQRVGLARALARSRAAAARRTLQRPGPRTRTSLADELLGIWWQHKVTVVFVTHQLDEALHLGDAWWRSRRRVALDARAKDAQRAAASAKCWKCSARVTAQKHKCARPTTQARFHPPDGAERGGPVWQEP